MIFDTDVIIWLFKGNIKAIKLIDDTSECRISVITMMELIQGCRDKKELSALRNFVAESGFEIIPLSENMSHRALIYMEEFRLKAAMELADSLIGSTAVELCLTLCTGNKKHYSVISELEIRHFIPH